MYMSMNTNLLNPKWQRLELDFVIIFNNLKTTRDKVTVSEESAAANLLRILCNNEPIVEMFPEYREISQVKCFNMELQNLLSTVRDKLATVSFGQILNLDGVLYL